MIKITVVKTSIFQELVDGEKAALGGFNKCARFYEGQEIELESISKMPEEFCSWAWADIQRDLAMIEYGATPEPKLTNPNSIYSCCSEGLRPVVFKIEKIG
jgi:uncharacterized repeat protein (TIGR04076 family)